MATPRLAYEEVARQLREQILKGELSAGSRLPTEAELCEHFRVGRSTVREALRLLMSRRLVTTSRGVGGGSSVAQLEAGDVTEMLGDAIVLLKRSDRTSLDELYEVRDLLEVSAARLAALRRSAEQLARLRASVPDSPSALRTGALLEANLAFHELLLEMTGNRMLLAVTRPMLAAIEGSLARERAPQRHWRRVLTEHRAILVAVEAGDPRRAAEEMAAHLAYVREAYAVLEQVRRGR